MFPAINCKNLIIGVGGAGSVFLDTAIRQNFSDTACLGIKSEEDVMINSEQICAAEKIFIVGSFASPNLKSAYNFTESILAKTTNSAQKIYFMIILPFKFEGNKRRELSFSRIKKLSELNYPIMAFDNQDLVNSYDDETPLTDAFEMGYQKICGKIYEFMQGDFNAENKNWCKWQFLLNSYAEELNQLEWFQHFPSMLPYIGSNYQESRQLKILFVGEKSYRPSSSPLPAYLKELDEILSEYFHTGIGQSITNTAYLNILKRPEPEEVLPVEYRLNGTTYLNLATTLKQIISVIKPDLVLFVSDKAWDEISPHLGLRVLNKSVNIDFVAAPDGVEWHKKNCEYSKNKLRKLLDRNMKNSLTARYRRFLRYFHSFLQN